MLASGPHTPKEAGMRPALASAPEPVYEVYALKYGERDTRKCQFFYRDERTIR